MSEPLSYSLEDKVAIVRMDDGKANALSQPMIDALDAALARAEQEASALVLAGRPNTFCAGFNLKVFMSGPEATIALLRVVTELTMKLYGTSIPLVIACTGHAIGAGALLALSGDYRVGAVGAFKIGLNEVTIGLPLPVYAIELARDRLSKRALTQAALLAQIYDPEAARAVGYLDEVVPADQVLARARAEATRLAALPRVAYGATKKRLRGATIEHIRRTLDDDINAIRAAR
jgi:enoyl-CoA hydratase